ncbi:protein of unknown function [Candidatus Nitrosotalea okcheonensis]|uniref:Uncharacterized protein n=1 Tax=Candidatus Nitrosotalea okcheonensis TaxID=1903276 RepID=A0A2H1FH97_9ARCH|nr:protein of unknown function [Candidatus Nitrosotalea okcheonensis]
MKTNMMNIVIGGQQVRKKNRANYSEYDGKRKRNSKVGTR